MAVYNFFFLLNVSSSKVLKESLMEYLEQLFTAPVLMTVGWDFVQNCWSFVSVAELILSFDFFWQYQYVVSLKPAHWVWSWRESWSSLCVCLLSVIQCGVCCEPPAAFFSSEHCLTDLQNSVCGMFPKCKNLLHVTFKKTIAYHCAEISLSSLVSMAEE